MKLPVVNTQIQIRFTDLDPLGHVSNSVYMQYFDMGRMDFFKKIVETSECPANVVARIEIDLVREIRLNDSVHVETWCSAIGTKSMTVQQHIIANDQLVTRGTLVLVGFDNDKRQSIPLPRHWQVSEKNA